MRKNILKKTVAVMAMSTMMVAGMCQSAFAANDTLYYFVDCGDYNTATLTDGETFGIYNSVTEQAYGADATTGKNWGILDDYDFTPTLAPYDASYDGSLGVRTPWSWANEWGTVGDDLIDVTETMRYTKNMTEEGKDRELKYKFELPDGTYSVEVGFYDLWNLSESPDIEANGTLVADEFSIATNAVEGSTNKAVFKGDVTVSGGALTLRFTDEAACVNVSYIKVYGDAPSTDSNSTDNTNTDTNTNTNTNTTTTPNTGDTTAVMPMLALALAAAALVLKKRTVVE